MNLTINHFKNDVYIGIDKSLLKDVISKVTAAKIARNLGLNRDTVEKWYRWKDRALSVSDLKYVCNITKINSNIFKVKWLGGRGNLRNRLIPFLNPNLAYFVGLIVGDGHLYDNRIVISAEEDVAKEIIVPHCRKTFPNMKIIARDMKDCFWVELNSRPLVWFIRDVFHIPIGNKTKTIRIPDIIQQSDRLMSPFLQGLFDADGYIGKKGNISFCTISSNLRDDVRDILIKWGFDVRFRVDRRGKNPVYYIRFSNRKSVKLFKEKIGFKNYFKASRLKALC